MINNLWNKKNVGSLLKLKIIYIFLFYLLVLLLLFFGNLETLKIEMLIYQ